MTEHKDAASSLARAELTLFLRYCAVGAAGFIADAAVLLALMHGFGMNPLIARIFSFSLAVMLTFVLNQHWTFGGGTRQGLIASFVAYLGVQGFGLICNAVVFAIGVLLLPAPLNAALFSLALAAAVALAVNYEGAKHLVFTTGDATGKQTQ